MVVRVRAEAEAAHFPSACLFGGDMKSASKKSLGRPITGHGIQVGERWSPEAIERIDDWRRKQDDIPARSSHPAAEGEEMSEDTGRVPAHPTFYPAPGLPDTTPIECVRFPTRIRNALMFAGWKTIGEIRESSDATLLSLENLGKGSVAHLRRTLSGSEQK